MSSGHVYLYCCFLISPFSKFEPTKMFAVEKITDRYVWIFDGRRRGGSRHRIDRDWLAHSPWVAAVKDSSLSATVRFHGSAARGGCCVAHLDDKPLPDDMIGFSEIVGPDSHRRVWDICPESVKPYSSIWPVDSDSNIVTLRRRGWPKTMTPIRMSVFDLWLICCGFVDGYDAVYAGE